MFQLTGTIVKSPLKRDDIVLNAGATDGTLIFVVWAR